MKILYITYIDILGEQTSGSSVRPNKMLTALQNEGHNVFLLSGSQSFSKRGERRKAIARVHRWLKENHFDLCYIESPTYPIMMHKDRSLIKKISRLKIPTGYFYRDCYLKFPDLYPPRKGLIAYLKYKALQYLQYKTDRVLKNVDIVYVPSEEAKSFYSFRDMRVLPPAGEDCVVEEKGNKNTVIYVGGISGHYGFDLLLDAFEILNNTRQIFRLICVCRYEEWRNFIHRSKNAEWMDVYHDSGSRLKEHYRNAVVAVIPKRANPYNDVAVSVKLFEYMSYGLPVVAVSSSATNRIISNYEIGVITEDNAEALANGIKSLLADDSYYNLIRNNVIHSLRKENLWIHRVRQIIGDLSEV